VKVAGNHIAEWVITAQPDSSQPINALNGDRQIMKNIMISLVRDEQGQDLIEYALLAGLIAVICVASVTLAGSKVSELFSKVGASLP
jgi:pilus assembly protein Flp/PilA